MGRTFDGAKRVVDLLAVIAMPVVLTSLLAPTALAIRIAVASPVLLPQERAG